MRTTPAVSFLTAFLLLAASAAGDGGGDSSVPAYQLPVEGLDAAYYGKSCPNMEAIIQTAVQKAIGKDYTIAAALIRLFFHDFAVQGCDASVLLDAPGSEKYADASKTLRGFDLIEAIKTELEARCPGAVSCADILVAAARDAANVVGVPYWSLRYGRKDGRNSIAAEADKYVPMGSESVTTLVDFFQSRGLNVLDLVALSGAHTIGRATCGRVKPRLCGGDQQGKDGGPGGARWLDRRYSDFLRRKCSHSGADYVELDGETPTMFDNQYYKNLMHGMGVLDTDQKLLADSRTGTFVTAMANGDKNAFINQFARSMRRLGEAQVFTGKEGEVRRKCSAINGHSY